MRAVHSAAASPAPERAVRRQRASLQNRRAMRPYERFEHGGLNLFQSTGAAFKPFRVY